MADIKEQYEKIRAFWQAQSIKSAAELSVLLSGNLVKFAYHSAKIENENVTYNDTREIFEHDGVVKYTGDLRTLYEIRNSKDAFELFFACFDKREAITPELVKSFQRELTKNTYDERRYSLGERPGEYKKHDYVIGREEVGAFFEDVDEEMNELIAELKDVKREKILTAAAYLHAKFENIHPFADGNGRTGRLLMNYFLVLSDAPPIIIFEEDRGDYYSALEKWDDEQDLKPLENFLGAQTIKTWEKYFSRKSKK